jgi:hypothetical protein
MARLGMWKGLSIPVALALVLAMRAVEATTLYEHYNTGDTGGLQAACGSCCAQ